MRILVLLAFVSACTQTHGGQTAADAFSGLPFVVFNAQDSRTGVESLAQCGGPILDSITGYWKPSARDVQNVESSLLAVLRSRPEAPSDSAFSYHRQHMGVIASGRRFVVTNGFHVSYLNQWRRMENLRHQSLDGFKTDSVWRKHAVVMCDAGLRRFTSVYDIGSRTVTHFAFDQTLIGPVPSATAR
jgi:hypothetical protein